MVSAIIVLLGIVKFFTLDKIRNETVRDILTSLASLGLCFAGVFGLFWVKGISYDYYWVVSAIMCVITILVYWAYAHLGFKPFIHWLGTKVLTKVSLIFSNANDIEEFKAQVAAIPSQIKKAKNPTDTELKNL